MTGIEGLILAMKNRPETFHHRANLKVVEDWMGHGKVCVVELHVVDKNTGFYFDIQTVSLSPGKQGIHFKTWLATSATEDQLNEIINLCAGCCHKHTDFNIEALYGSSDESK